MYSLLVSLRDGVAFQKLSAAFCCWWVKYLEAAVVTSVLVTGGPMLSGLCTVLITVSMSMLLFYTLCQYRGG